MVAHEDVRVHADVMLRHRFAQQLIEVVSIDVVYEDRAAIDATLGDMNRISRKVEARTAGHAASMASGDQPRSRRNGAIAVGSSPRTGVANSLRPLWGGHPRQLALETHDLRILIRMFPA